LKSEINVVAQIRFGNLFFIEDSTVFRDKKEPAKP